MTRYLMIGLVLLSSCAVRDYPRPVTARDRVASNYAWNIDTAGALLYVPIKIGNGYDFNRQRTTIDYSYYLDPRFREDPRSFYPRPAASPEPVVRKLEENKDVEFFLLTWPSQYQPQNPAFAIPYATYTETHTAYGIYCKARRGNRGAVVMSHGWTGPEIIRSYKSEPMLAFAQNGYDSVLIQQPYHGLRQPAGSVFSGEYFISGELSRLNEAMCQTVTDVRSMVMWLRPKYDTVGLRGGSLGGITTLQAAAVEDKVDFAIAWVPPSSFGDLPEDSPLVRFVIRGIRESGIDQAKAGAILYVSSPKNFKPLINKQDVLLIAGMGDNFVPPQQTLMVWEAWDRPMIYWFAGGHVLNFDRDNCNEIERQFLIAHLPGE